MSCESISKNVPWRIVPSRSVSAGLYLGERMPEAEEDGFRRLYADADAEERTRRLRSQPKDGRHETTTAGQR